MAGRGVTFLQVMQHSPKTIYLKGNASVLHDALSALTLMISDDLLGYITTIQYSKQHLGELIKSNSPHSSKIRKG